MELIKETRLRRFLLLCMFAVGFAFNGRAQSFALPDSLLFLSQDEFLNIVRSYHPVVKQANLLVDRAAAELIAARAGFDPLLYADGERKTFDGKNYYNIFNPELKVPTWYGIEFKAGLEENYGDNLNNSTTPAKSSYLGVSVPLARNLVMDKRRAVLQQAKVFREQSKAERLEIVNDLLAESADAYWRWVREFMIYRIMQDAITVNRERYRLIRIGYEQGDRPAIDTTEALAQLQSFEMARNDAWVGFRNAGLELSNYMWKADDSAFYLPPQVIPDTAWNKVAVSNVGLPKIEDMVQITLMEHPKLKQFDFKLQILEIDRKLKFQELLPVVNLNYNFLNSGYNVLKGASWALYENNYKFGFNIGVPLRLSQGRGQYRAAKIKISETNLDLAQTRLILENKVRYYFNNLANLQIQIALAESNLDNYQRLFRGEDTRFRVGESSLFLLNSRENKVLEARQKLAELKTKFFNTYIDLQAAAGQLR
jgi:outer membrane protein TolC